MLADLEGRFTEIIDNYEWEVVHPRTALIAMHWHIGCRNSTRSSFTQWHLNLKLAEA